MQGGVSKYTVLGGELYRRLYSGPLLRCVHPKEPLKVLAEIHEGHYRNHFGGRSFAHKAQSQGFYCPMIRVNAQKYATNCEKCQLFSPLTYIPLEKLTTFLCLWPFMLWELDIV